MNSLETHFSQMLANQTDDITLRLAQSLAKLVLGLDFTLSLHFPSTTIHQKVYSIASATIFNVTPITGCLHVQFVLFVLTRFTQTCTLERWGI